MDVSPETVRLAVYDDSLTPIMEAWAGANKELRQKIRAQSGAGRIRERP